MIRYLENKPKLVLGLKLLFIALFTLAIMVPFAGQAFSFDGPLMLHFASVQSDHPLQQHIDNFDYFGIRFDRYFNTHPRFFSFYLSLVIRIAGGIAEVPIHLSLITFTLMGGFGMFFLGRRFGVSGVTAALLFLASPILMVSSHTEMVDAPGICLWVVAMAAFIYGVDKNRIWLLVLAGILLQLTIFTFFQGLTALGLALIYLILKKRLSVRTLLPIVLPALVFIGYLLWFVSIYGQPPRFTYRIAPPDYQKVLLSQARGVIVVMGGALLFPLVTLFGYWRNWRALIAGLLSGGVLFPWFIVKAGAGDYSMTEAVLLAGFISTGLTICYTVLESTVIGVISWIRKRDNDVLLLCAWFLGVFIYCVFFLGYPSPRYFLPATPAVILLMLRLWRGTMMRWPAARALLAALAVGVTLAFGLVLSLAYVNYANEGRQTADWALEKYGNWNGRVWFSGELGFAYYMRKNGFSMVPGVWGNRYAETTGPWPPYSPATGDIIIYSALAGEWLPMPDVLARTRPLEEHFTWTDEPVVLWSENARSRWSIALLLPFNLTDQRVRMDDILVVNIVDEAVPLPDYLQQEVDKWK